jgi:hypothetical protein
MWLGMIIFGFASNEDPVVPPPPEDEELFCSSSREEPSLTEVPALGNCTCCVM